MTGTGKAIVALLLLVGVAVALMVRVTGPGRRAAVPVDAGAGAQVPTALPPATGPLPVPVRGVAPATLVDSFADPRGDGTRTHDAIDIMAPVGTPVTAVADGRVEKLFESVPGGLTLYQRSADGGTVYYYAHLSAYAAGIAEGQAVRAGQTIAAVGATGDADPGAPHLHFEVHRMAAGERWWQGRAIDPYPLLRGAG